MKTKTLAITFLAIITLVSCMPIITAIPTKTAIPYPYKIINHDKPNLQANFSPFKNMGCALWGNNIYTCQEDGLLLSMGCDTIEFMPLLGGLSPNYPIAGCALEFAYDAVPEDRPDTENECFYEGGAFFIHTCERYVLYQNNNYRLVKTMDEFRTIFAPVDSPEEALGFALVSDNFFADYGQEKRSEYIYSVKELEDSHVETTAEGYIVHVFYKYGVSCGPHETYAVQINVTHDGFVNEINRRAVYRNPLEDDMCID